jgi:Xaa-Pro aminopeptidase
MESQAQMSIAIEPVNSVVRDCAKIAKTSYEAGMKVLRPGTTFGEVVQAMEKPIKDAGAWHLTPLIHSLNPLVWVGPMGVGIHKLPGIERYHHIMPTPTLGAEKIIQAKTVWELEPNACLGKHRVNIGGTVLVTEQGAMNLNKLAIEMQVVG